jgi:predicted dehydrogenase
MSTRKPFEFVIEGVGDVVQRYYAPSLKALKEKNKIEITFVDQSKYWTDDPDQQLRKKHEEFINMLGSWGAKYLDKSTPDGNKAYENLTADVVFIATPDYTHVDLTLPWLEAPSRSGRIFIEKPLDSDLAKARDLLSKIKMWDPKIRVLDHYMARAHPLHDPMVLKAIYGELGGRITSFSFYLLENRSGPPRVGPLENDSRVKATRAGLILDLMPHIPAILSMFGVVETIRVSGMRVGQYTGVDGDPSKRSLIDNETFAHVRFGFLSHRPGHFIRGNAYIGKGIRGSKALGIEGEVKLLELEGANGRKLRCDLRSSGNGSSKAWSISKDGKKKLACDLTPEPYDLLIRDAVRSLEDPSHVSQLSLPVETAKSVLSTLEEMRWAIRPLKKEALPTYALGTGGDQAPYLEDVVAMLPPILPFM